MSIVIYPTRTEGYDTDTKDLLFTVESFDDVCCNVEIKTVVTSESWVDISLMVEKALKRHETSEGIE